jgi:hypothetical protein
MNTFRSPPFPPLVQCARCQERPRGEPGHPDLRFHLSGPYPGHNIFVCEACGDRWIRHYGSVEERHAWTRYAEQFPTVGGRRTAASGRGVAFPF